MAYLYIGYSRQGPNSFFGVCLNPTHDKRTRANIQTGQLVIRLTQFVNQRTRTWAQWRPERREQQP